MFNLDKEEIIYRIKGFIRQMFSITVFAIICASIGYVFGQNSIYKQYNKFLEHTLFNKKCPGNAQSTVIDLKKFTRSCIYNKPNYAYALYTIKEKIDEREIPKKR